MGCLGGSTGHSTWGRSKWKGCTKVYRLGSCGGDGFGGGSSLLANEGGRSSRVSRRLSAEPLRLDPRRRRGSMSPSPAAMCRRSDGSPAHGLTSFPSTCRGDGFATGRFPPLRFRGAGSAAFRALDDERGRGGLRVVPRRAELGGETDRVGLRLRGAGGSRLLARDRGADGARGARAPSDLRRGSFATTGVGRAARAPPGLRLRRSFRVRMGGSGAAFVAGAGAPRGVSGFRTAAPTFSGTGMLGGMGLGGDIRSGSWTTLRGLTVKSLALVSGEARTGTWQGRAFAGESAAPGTDLLSQPQCAQ